ncbi:MAG: hypothetical protein F6K18_16135 [Okeania sp. SIO2C2]|uniref:hypothetical protein n=1 Tax=Okeania sp. SIO2C2 TaxID=2607787 RepID=UPI0013BB55D2|nr:hypothetical protein [Okeania sp. SIO2C2]NEP88234.1 hypothetical protein [Okeania sp. SIO2C2]
MRKLIMQELQKKQLFTKLNSKESTYINGGYNENYQYRRNFLGFQLCPRSYYGDNRYYSDYQPYNYNYYKGNIKGYY